MDKHKYTEESEHSFQFMKRQKVYRHTGELYIDRLILIRCFLGSVMFHRIYLTDNDCMHDHPWPFRTFIIKGGYWEHTPPGDELYPNRIWYKPGSWLYRPADYTHRLEIPEGKQAWTLVFTGPEKRVWGFWTPSGWKKSHDYTNVGSCK